MKLPYTIQQLESFIQECNKEFLKKSLYEKLANTSVFKINEYQISKNKYKNQDQWYITNKNSEYYNFSNNTFDKLVPNSNQNPDDYYSQNVLNCFQIIKNITQK